jgi:pyridoxamine 5'-phosphate oxidase
VEERPERPLREEEVDPDPIRQFERWLREAGDAGIPLPHAMSLATASSDGRPSIRSVLLNKVDHRGFVFYTNTRSRKAAELAANPWAAVALRWVELEREVRIEGMVEQVSSREADAYFASRPRESQLAAWASPQSEVIESRSRLERWMEEAKARFAGRSVPRPPHWGGYRVRPEGIEFWQHRPSRLHDRLRYTLLEDGTWRLERVAP